MQQQEFINVIRVRCRQNGEAKEIKARMSALWPLLNGESEGESANERSAAFAAIVCNAGSSAEHKQSKHTATKLRLAIMLLRIVVDFEMRL
jgi:hypothetical protein